ncbi:MAG: hypothetical protein FJW38_19525 [Acidobacteria bacterium]|nr:hypothetical protein [Acidobacteriota bacterium]
MNYLAYLLCAVLVFPAVLLGGALVAIRTATAGTASFWGFLWELFKGFIDLLDSPVRLLGLLASVVVFFAAGAIDACRVPAHLVIAGLGVAATAYFFWLTGREAIGWFPFFVPSLIGAGLSVWFACKR